MSNDNQLQQAVLAELKWEPSVTAAHVGVTAKRRRSDPNGSRGKFRGKTRGRGGGP